MGWSFSRNALTTLLLHKSHVLLFADDLGRMHSGSPTELKVAEGRKEEPGEESTLLLNGVLRSA
jgi:hypothetical protein